MKRLAILILLTLTSSLLTLSAAVPLRWTVETSSANPATFDQFAGATYDLEATLQSRGRPLAVTGDPKLYWQTNGMGSAWWTSPATASGNVLRATWTPACDVGSRVYNCFIGITSTVYNAAFQLRLRPSPGSTPNELPLPRKVIDFSTVTVLNPPWTGGGSARPLPPYLHALDFADSYPDDAAWYYAQQQDYGHCSAVRDGNTFSRNYDWTFDGAAEFVVRMAAGPGRLASVGLANVGTNLTESIVTSGKWSRYYKCLPGHTVDGINENGVACCINVTSGTTEDWWGSALHPLAAVRWVLDNATNAQHGAEYLAQNIGFPEGWKQNFHYMVADESATYIVENGEAHLVEDPEIGVPPVAVMTNFRLYPFRDTTGEGQERYDSLSGGANITSQWWTLAYLPTTSPVRVSDIGTETNAIFAAWASKPRNAHRGETFGGTNTWWQTVHTSVYDITNRVLRVAVQECDDWYVFGLPGGGAQPVSLEGLRRVDDFSVSDLGDMDPTDGWIFTPPLLRGDRLFYGTTAWDRETAGWYVVSDGFDPETDYPHLAAIDENYNLNTDPRATRLTIRSLEGDPAVVYHTGRKAVRPGDTLVGSGILGEVIDMIPDANGMRTLDDEYVYAPAEFSPFAWSGEREDALDVIGDMQPYVDSTVGEYTSWSMAFEMNGVWYWGSAYDKTVSPVVTFNFEGEYFDEDYQEWFYDSFELEARRTVTRWERANPIDTFAHQRDLTRTVASINAMSNSLYAGETKRMRTGEWNHYGTGWGYFRRPIDSDLRSWRIVADRLTTSGYPTSPSQTMSPLPTFAGTNATVTAMANPFAAISNCWAVVPQLTHTDGTYGTEKTELADYEIGIVRIVPSDTNSPFLVRFRLENLSRSPRVYRITPILDGYYETTEWIGGTTRRMACRDAALPWANDRTGHVISYTRYYYHTRIGAVYVDPEPVVATNTVRLTFYAVSDEDCETTSALDPGPGTSGKRYMIAGGTRTFNVDVSFDASYSDNWILPAGTTVTESNANLYYDPVLDATFRIALTNGCFFSEQVSTGDWRKGGIR